MGGRAEHLVEKYAIRPLLTVEAARNFGNIRFACPADVVPPDTLSHAVIFSCNQQSLSFISKTIFRLRGEHEKEADEKDGSGKRNIFRRFARFLAIIALGAGKSCFVSICWLLNASLTFVILSLPLSPPPRRCDRESRFVGEQKFALTSAQMVRNLKFFSGQLPGAKRGTKKLSAPARNMSFSLLVSIIRLITDFAYTKFNNGER